MERKTYQKPQTYSIEIDTESIICMSVNGTTDTPLSKDHEEMWDDEMWTEEE